MKKILLLLGAITFCYSQVQAQHIKIGPEIGINWTKFNVDQPGIDQDDYKSLAGLKIGGIADIRFDRMFSIQPGLFFSQKGSKEKYTDFGGATNTYHNNKIRVNYLEIPLNFQLRFGHPYRGQFFIGAGPYLAFAVGGEITTKTTVRDDDGFTIDASNDSYDLEIGDDDFNDDVKGTDAGLNLNLGFMAPRGFFIRGNAGIGLSNILPGGDDDYSVRNLSAGLSIGFLFGH